MRDRNAERLWLGVGAIAGAMLVIGSPGCGSSGSDEEALGSTGGTETMSSSTAGTTAGSTAGTSTTSTGTTSPGSSASTTGESDTGSESSVDGSSSGGDPQGVATTDDFDEDSLAQWSRLDPSAAQARIENGALVVEPADNSLWYNASTADFIFKETTGDFVLTAPVRVASLTGGLPATQYRLGGLMIRDPAPDAEDYVFVVLGADADDLSTESKTTDDGQSTFWGPAWPVDTAELRLCRVGSSLRTLVREVGQSGWIELQAIERPDLPDRVQFGAVTYANNTPADLVVTFDSIHIQPISDSSECQGP